MSVNRMSYIVYAINICSQWFRLQVEWVIGVGVFAEERAKNALKEITSLKFGRILHPSPAPSAANKGWGEKSTCPIECNGSLEMGIIFYNF